MRKLLALTLLASLAACRPTPDPVQAAIDASLAKAKADSLRGARLESTAKHHYALGRQAEDSATFYHLQSHAIPATPTDSATLLRTITDYFTPRR